MKATLSIVLECLTYFNRKSREFYWTNIRSFQGNDIYKLIHFKNNKIIYGNRLNFCNLSLSFDSHTQSSFSLCPTRVEIVSGNYKIKLNSLNIYAIPTNESDFSFLTVHFYSLYCLTIGINSINLKSFSIFKIYFYLIFLGGKKMNKLYEYTLKHMKFPEIMDRILKTRDKLGLIQLSKTLDYFLFVNLFMVSYAFHIENIKLYSMLLHSRSHENFVFEERKNRLEEILYFMIFLYMSIFKL